MISKLQISPSLHLPTLHFKLRAILPQLVAVVLRGSSPKLRIYTSSDFALQTTSDPALISNKWFSADDLQTLEVLSAQPSCLTALSFAELQLQLVNHGSVEHGLERAERSAAKRSVAKTVHLKGNDLCSHDLLVPLTLSM